MAAALLLGVVCLAQTSSTLLTPEIRRVGDKLACLCKSCKNTVATCQMLQCHYALPAREKIAAMQKEGQADQAIVDSFVKKEGVQALAVPPAEGFNVMAWVAPPAMTLAGLGLIGWFIRRYRRPTEPVASDDQVKKFQAQIDKEFSDIEE